MKGCESEEKNIRLMDGQFDGYEDERWMDGCEDDGREDSTDGRTDVRTMRKKEDWRN